MLWAEACGPPTQDTGTEALPRGPRSLLAGAALHGAAGLPHGRLVDEHGVGGVAGLQQVLLPVLVGCRDMKGMGAGPRAPRGVGLDGLGGAVTAPGGDGPSAGTWQAIRTWGSRGEGTAVRE